ncbi:MAG: glycosyltransferase [Methylomonas sp.]|jgi:glycosyltransferase involved in cell wall biosynthesis
MNILFLIRAIGGGGGAERQLTELAKGLTFNGHQVTVAVLYGGGDFEAQLMESGVQIIDLKKSGFWDISGFLTRYISALKRLRPDVLHGYMPMQNLLALLGKLFLPKTTRIAWGLRDSNIGYGSISMSRRIVFKLTCWLSPLVDVIISNSEAGKHFHVNNGYPANLIGVIHNGVDVDYFRRVETARLSMRQKWGVSAEEVLVGNVARLDRKKDHPNFLRACAILMQTQPRLKIVCAGEDSPEYRLELQSLADDLRLQDRLIWAGLCDDMISVYSALDLEVSSSLYEGFPNAVAEAMSCQVPVVATDAGDVKLMLDGVGICVPPGEPAALAEGMSVMLHGDLAAIGRASRERIVENYRIDKLVRQTEILLAINDRC